MQRCRSVFWILSGLYMVLFACPAWAGYVNNDDGTVTDTFTGLMWQQETPDNLMTWEQALSYCENSNLAGYTDWRLPTRKELRSLVDHSQYYPAINITYFPETFSSFYWSSTTYASGTNSTWGVDFTNGEDSNNVNSYKYFNFHVRAVRGGQSEPLSAQFTATPASGQAPLTVQFADTSTGSPVAWAWTFGNGGTSTEQNPSHSYNAEGSYTVSLTVTNASNDQNAVTKANLITVAGSGGCQAQKVLNSAGDGKAEKKASILREFRDKALAGTPAGQEMIRLYYKHDAEINKILAGDPGLTADCLQVMIRAWPVVYRAIDTGKGIQIPDGVFNDALQVLDWVAAAGSYVLKADINKVKAFLISRKK